MSKVTSKLQVTLPKAIARQYGIRPGDEIDWVLAGDVIRVIPPSRRASGRKATDDRALRLRLFDQATERQRQRELAARKRTRVTDRGWRRGISTTVAALVDTNVLVYRFDPRFPQKQGVASGLLRRGIADDSIRIAHQAIVEFVAAVTRPLSNGRPLLSEDDARREAEEMLAQFTVLWPNDAIVRTALRGAATYRLQWFDAHMWAYAEYYGLGELISEDFQTDRMYGAVRVTNPFAHEGD